MLASWSHEGVIFLDLLSSSHSITSSLFPYLGSTDAPCSRLGDPVPPFPRWRPHPQGPRTFPYRDPEQFPPLSSPCCCAALHCFSYFCSLDIVTLIFVFKAILSLPWDTMTQSLSSVRNCRRFLACSLVFQQQQISQIRTNTHTPNTNTHPHIDNMSQSKEKFGIEMKCHKMGKRGRRKQ